MTETKSNETIRLICCDADAIVIEVQSNVKRESSEFIGEVYAVRILENRNRIASMVYVVSGGGETGENSLSISYFIWQADSAVVRLENLASNTSYDVSVSIVNPMLVYRSLPVMNAVRTLPSQAHRPQVIPQERIKLRHFTMSKNPNLLDVEVQWEPAEGMHFAVNSDLWKNKNDVT